MKNLKTNTALFGSIKAKDANGLHLQDDGGNGMFIEDGGNVGIGTTNPGYDFEVIGWISAQANAFDTDAVINLAGSNSSTYGAVSRIMSTSESSSNGSSSLTFYTRNSSNTIAEKMRINSSGNVGIGTTNPDSKLTIGGVNNPAIKLISAYNSELADAVIAVNEAGSVSIEADPSNNSVTYQTNFSVAIDGNEHMRITSAGNVGIGTKNPSAARLDVWQAETSSDSCIKTVRPGTADRKHLAFYNGNGIVGDIKTSGSTTSYNTSSDYRLKTDVQPMAGATERLKALKPVNFEWIADGTRVDGFIAHEVQEIVPEAISGEKDAEDENGNIVPQAIDQSKLVPLLTSAIQEQQQIIEDLKSQNESLVARIEALEG